MDFIDNANALGRIILDKNIPVRLLPTSKQLDLISYNRRDGNTTRMTDVAIQLLFKGYTVVIEDHYETVNEFSKVAAKRYILDRIVGRMMLEHRIGIGEGVSKSRNQYHTIVSINNDPYTIKLVDPIEVDKNRK